MLPDDGELEYLPDDSDGPSKRRRLVETGAAREFARRYLVLGQTCAAAARAVGWPASKGHTLLRSADWHELKADIAATFDLTREQLFHEVNDLVVENAIAGAQVQNAMLQGRLDDLPRVRHEVLARVTDSAMDRAGLRAPTRVDHKVEVSLDQATVGRIQLALEQYAGIAAIDVNKHELAYALAKPVVQQAEADEMPQQTDA